MPQASIIVSAHNAAATLLQTLESLLNQTYRDFEIIVVDDGSTDATRRLAEACCVDQRLRVVHQSYRGAAGARNTGISLARGRFVGFCDAGDQWQPQKLATHVQHLGSNLNIGLSYSGADMIDENNCPFGQAEQPKLRNVSPAHLFRRNPVGTVSSVLARREALDDLCYRPHTENDRDWVFDEQLKGYEDFECWLRLAMTTTWKIEGVPGLLTRKRMSTRRTSDRFANQIAAWERMMTALRPTNPGFFAQFEPAARAHQFEFPSPVPTQVGEMDMSMDSAGQDGPVHTGARYPEPRIVPGSFASMAMDETPAEAIQPVTRSAPANWV